MLIIYNFYIQCLNIVRWRLSNNSLSKSKEVRGRQKPWSLTSLEWNCTLHLLVKASSLSALTTPLTPATHTHTTACDHHSILSIWGAVSFDQPGGGLMSVDQSTCLPFFWRVGSSQEEANFFCINLMSQTLS